MMAPTTKIIFLDFDGPISNGRVALAYGDHHVMDPVALRALNHICEASGAKIVCTSTRALNNARDYKTCMREFEEGGLDIRNIHPDWSCNESNGGRRYDHIQSWLRNHPEVTHYAVIDDERVFSADKKLIRNFIKTDMMEGLSLGNLRRLEKMLDFNMSEAFRRAHDNATTKGQFCLEFDDWDARFNTDLLAIHLK